MDSAISVATRVFNIPKCMELLNWLDDNCDKVKNPFQSSSAFQALIDRAKTPDNIVLALSGLVDSFRMNQLDFGHFSVNKLKDPRESPIEIQLAKGRVKEVILSPAWLGGLKLMPEVTTKMAIVFADFSSVRTMFSGYPVPEDNADTDMCIANVNKDVDTSYMCGWGQSATLAFELFDAVIYSNEFNGRYKDLIKSRGTVEDFLTYPSVAARIEAIAEAVRSEQPAPNATGTGTGSSGSGGGSGGTPNSTVADATGNSAAAVTTPVVAIDDSVEAKYLKMSEEDQRHWDKYIMKMVRSTVRCINQDKKTTAAFIEAIKECPLCMIRGDPTGLVGYHFDIAKAGEAATRPDLRICPLRDGVYCKLVRTVLQARSDLPPDEATLGDGEFGILIDGGRKGNQARLLAPWKEGTSKATNKNKKGDDDEEEVEDDEDEDDGKKPGFVPALIQLGLTEESLAQRRQVVRGTASIKQVQWAHVVASKKVSLPERPRKHFEGSNSGDLISNIKLPPLPGNEWYMTVAQKKKLFGKKNLIPVGGKTVNDDINPIKKRTDDVTEPVCWQSLPEELLEEFVHDFFCKLILDLTPLDAKFAWVCLKLRIAYVAFTFNEDHSEMIYKRLYDLLKAALLQEGSGFYNVQFAKAMGVEDTESVATAKATEAAATAKAKAKAAAKAASALKRKAAVSAKAEAKASAKASGKAEAQPKKKAKKTSEEEPGSPDGFSGDDGESSESEDAVWDPLAES